MVQPIMKDPIFLAQRAQPATEADLPVGQDLMDTLLAHEQECVGMAANMIGVNKSIIAINDGQTCMLMFNPSIISQSDAYETEEGCLSLIGVRKTTRYQTIRVAYQNHKLQPKTKTFHGFAAQIVQHEIDHLSGILI